MRCQHLQSSSRDPSIFAAMRKASVLFIDPSGELLCPGSAEKKVYIATGDSGQGMTGGTIAGIVISSQILGKPHPWSEVQPPSASLMSAAASCAPGITATHRAFCCG